MASSLWPYHALLPDVLVEETDEEERKKARELAALDDRLCRLEGDAKSTTQLGQTPSLFSGFELNTTTIMFGVIVGLVVYVLVSSHYESQKPVRGWWQW